MSIVYRITNLTNGKSYVGQTIFSLQHRWSAHKSSTRQGSKWRFHEALRKYGFDCWKQEVIFESLDIEEIRRYEYDIIVNESLTDNKNGYNSKLCGCGGNIVKPENREKWIKKLSIASSGMNNPNSVKTTNEEIIELGIRYFKEFDRLPSAPAIRDYGNKNDILVPKFFTKWRNWPQIVKDMETITGSKYDPYFAQRNRKKND